MQNECNEDRKALPLWHPIINTAIRPVAREDFLKAS